MKVYRSLQELPKFKRAVLTIGAYDGVHNGHRQILERLVECAQKIDGTSVVLTFFPHPRKVVFPNDHSLQLLTTLKEKIDLLEECGIEHLIIAPFTVEFSQINPYDYVEKIIIGQINPAQLIIGYDHRFGLNREGNIELLRSYSREGHFEITEIPEHEIDSLKISSTRIRNYLKEGHIRLANKLLGKVFRMSGTIVHGQKVAGELGFPTANVQLDEGEKLIPHPGTYAATALLNDSEYEGMLYIGKRKTLGLDETTSIEINLFHHFDQSFYGSEIVIFLHAFIRPDQHLSSRRELLDHISFDKTEVSTYFQCHHRETPNSTTVAILNWNGIDLLRRYLPGLVKESAGIGEVLLIDNHSADESLDWVTNNLKEVTVLSHPRNLGFTGGYNEATDEIQTKYTVFLNNDVAVTPGWLEALIKYMEAHPETAAVQPKIRWDRHREKFEYAGASGGFLDGVGYPFCRGRVFDYLEDDVGQYDTPVQVFWASGAALMIRTALFQNAGGFDTDFFAHQEEIDLCWRLKNMGYKIACVPSSTVFHLGASTLPKENPRKTYLNIRNNWWMILKNERAAKLLWIVPVRLVLDVTFGLKLLIEGKIPNAWALLKALGAVSISLVAIKRKRIQTAFIRKRLTIGPPNYKGRINVLLPLWTYAFGKKTFQRIVK